MIEENNASSGAVESSAQQSQAEAKPAQSELTAQDILAASTVQTELSAGNQDTGKSRWYIVHTYSGFEQRVEATIKEMMRNAQDNGLIHEVVVPTEKVIELGKGGAKRTTTRKFYPGYIMLRMTMTDFSWHLVQSIPKVTGFVGGKNRPAPMKDEEAARILSLMETRQEQPRPKFSFERGDDVRVIARLEAELGTGLFLAGFHEGTTPSQVQLRAGRRRARHRRAFRRLQRRC